MSDACAGSTYQWGSGHWAEVSWTRVHVLAAVHELGFHVIHSDMDVTWFLVRGSHMQMMHAASVCHSIGHRRLRMRHLENPSAQKRGGIYICSVCTNLASALSPVHPKANLPCLKSGLPPRTLCRILESTWTARRMLSLLPI